jgi:hypothetical protein
LPSVVEKPSETLKELSETLKELSETLKEPSETLREPSETLKELSETLKELSETLKELSETLREPSETLKELSETLKEPSETLKEPSETLKELSETLKEPSETLKELSETLKEPSERDEALRAVRAIEPDPADPKDEERLLASPSSSGCSRLPSPRSPWVMARTTAAVARMAAVSTWLSWPLPRRGSLPAGRDAPPRDCRHDLRGGRHAPYAHPDSSNTHTVRIYPTFFQANAFGVAVRGLLECITL